MKKGGTKWTPALPLRRQDCIVSSKVRENNQTGFTPAYEKQPENMNFIMSNEYLRLWLKERIVYEVDTYSEMEIEGELKRKYVQRVMKPKKSSIRVMPIIKLKRFTRPSMKTNVNSDKEQKES